MFHKWVTEELAKIKKGDLVEPEYEMNPKTDHLLGEMSEELKKLFTLWRKASQATKAAKKTAAGGFKRILIELPEEPQATDVKEAEKKAEQLKRSIRLAEERECAMREVFWISVRDEFPEANDKSLAVCKGFKVLSIEDEVTSMSQAVELLLSGKI